MGRISEYLESCHSSLGQVVMACFLTMTLAIPSNFAPILAAGNVDESIDIEAPVDTEPNAKPVVESVTGEEATLVVEGKATDGLNVDVEWIDSAFDMKDLVFTEGKNIVWESDKTSTKRFTMRINYSDANCTNGYDAGALEIRVPLVAELSDDLIFADSNLSNPTHDFNWSYSNPRPDGTQDLVLRNNHAIPAGNNFTGTIQVIWQITNRGADRQWAIQAMSTATDKAGNTYEITGENTLTLAIRNTKDVFAPTFTISKITDISNMEEGWRDYIWVQYKFAPGQTKNSMPLSDGTYVFDIPSDCVVYNDGSLSPSTDTATKFFKRIGNPDKPETISFSVGWPRDTYDGQVATMTGYMTGTYANGDKLSESDAASTWSANLHAADYDFTYEGERFAIDQWAEYAETDTGILDGSRNSVENSLHFHVDAFGRNYPGEKYTYEILTDWFDITTNRNGYRALEANEISRISIYAPKGILGASGNARADQDDMVGKVYAYDANNVETFVGELTGISTGNNNDIVLPAGTAYGKIVYENVDGYVQFDDIDVIYETKVQTFDRGGTGMDANLSPLTGTIRHNAGLVATDASGAWANTVGPESYTGEQSEMAYNRDMNRYGHAIQRSYGEMSYREERKSIVSYKQNLELATSGAPSTSTEYIKQQMSIDWTATGHWSGDDTSVHPKYTNLTFMVELPQGWEYSPNQNWTTVTSKRYPIKTAVTKSNGKTLVRFDVDTSSHPLESAPNYDLWSELAFSFYAQIPLDLYYEYGRDYTFNAWSWVNGELSGATQVKGSGTTIDTNDLNGNGDTSEIIGKSAASLRLDAALGSHLEANERVQSPSTNGSWDTNATVKFGEAYSYKLSFMTGSTAVTNVVMFDTIEDGSDWHGTLTEADVSWLQKKGYHPKVYLTTDKNAPNDITNDSWETLDSFTGTKPLASAVRVAIALEGDTVPGSSYVRAVLKMKASENENDVAGSARDFYTVNFTNKEGIAMSLTSGEVSALLADTYGQLTITKRDATNQALMNNARFNVLNGSGAVVLENVAPGTYDLPVGTYTIVETEVPTGYVTPEAAFGPVTVVQDDTVSIDIENERKTGSIRIIKNDATSGRPMEGVTFTASLNGEVVAEKTTDASGVALFEGLVWGNYTIAEKDVPQGYVAMTPISVNITRTNADPLEPIEERVTNVRETGTVEIHKVDSITGEPVSGATFGLWGNFGAYGTYVKQATTDANGVARFTGVLWGKDYSIKERSNEGYVVSDAVTRFNLTRDQITEPYVIERENTPMTGSISIKKVDAYTSDVLPGAMFDVLSNGRVVRTGVTTNALGIATVSGLPWGTYEVVETNAPAGYNLNIERSTVAITRNNVVETQEIVVQNTPIYGNMTIVKYDEAVGRDTYLAGATLQVKHVDSGQTWTVESTEDEPIVLEHVPYGAYEIIETNAPSGYETIDPISFEFTYENDTCYVANEVVTTDITFTKNLPGNDWKLYALDRFEDINSTAELTEAMGDTKYFSWSNKNTGSSTTYVAMREVASFTVRSTSKQHVTANLGQYVLVETSSYNENKVPFAAPGWDENGGIQGPWADQLGMFGISADMFAEGGPTTGTDYSFDTGVGMPVMFVPIVVTEEDCDLGVLDLGELKNRYFFDGFEFDIAKKGIDENGNLVDLNAADATWNVFPDAHNGWNAILTMKGPHHEFYLEKPFVHHHSLAEVNRANPFGAILHHGDLVVEYVNEICIKELKAPTGWSNLDDNGDAKHAIVEFVVRYQGNDVTDLKMTSAHYFDEVGFMIYDDKSPAGRYVQLVKKSSPIRVAAGSTAANAPYSSSAPMFCAVLSGRSADALSSWSLVDPKSDAFFDIGEIEFHDKKLPTVQFTVDKKGETKGQTVQLNADDATWRKWYSGSSATTVKTSNNGQYSVLLPDLAKRTSMGTMPLGFVESVAPSGDWSTHVDPYDDSSNQQGFSFALVGYLNGERVTATPSDISYGNCDITLDEIRVQISRNTAWDSEVVREVPIASLGNPISYSTVIQGMIDYNYWWTIALSDPRWNFATNIDLGTIEIVDKMGYPTRLDIYKQDVDSQTPVANAKFSIWVVGETLDGQKEEQLFWSYYKPGTTTVFKSGMESNSTGHVTDLIQYAESVAHFVNVKALASLGNADVAWVYLDIREDGLPTGYGRVPYDGGERPAHANTVARLTLADNMHSDMSTAEKELWAETVNAPYLNWEGENNVVVNNRMLDATVKFTKIDGYNNQPMSGVSFALQKKGADGAWQAVTTVTTDRNGVFSWSTKDTGTYRVIENTPSGYVPVSGIEFTITAAMRGKTTYVGTSELDGVAKAAVINERSLVDLTVHKVDGDDTTESLAGAVFNLYDNNRTLLRSGITTNADGIAYVRDLPVTVGDEKYYLVEAQTPYGYHIDSSEWELIIVNGNTALAKAISISSDMTVEVKNYQDPQPEVLTVHKIDRNTKSDLSGAVFAVYNTNTGALVGVMNATDEGGLSSIALDAGSYILKEKTAPVGYECGEDILIDFSQSTTLDVYNDRIPSEINITKIDSETKNPMEGVKFGLLEESSELHTSYTETVDPLSHEQGSFQLYKDDILAFGASYCDVGSYDCSWEYNIPSPGMSVAFKGLGVGYLQTIGGLYDQTQLGSYYIEYYDTATQSWSEVVSDRIMNPKYATTSGNSLSDSDIEQGLLDYSYTFENAGKYRVRYAVDVRSSSIASFFNSLFVTIPVVGTVATENRWSGDKVLVQEGVTDQYGELSFSGLDFAEGSKRYYVSELEVPSGYVAPEADYLVEFNPDEPVTNVTLENTPAYGAIKVVKQFEGAADTEKVTSVAFDLYDNNGNLIEENIRANDAGEFIIDHLRYGDYVLCETATADGFVLADEIPVRIEGEAATEVVVNNVAERGSITVKKVDATSKAPLAGVEFQLLATDVDPAEVIATGVTDAFGTIVFDDMRVDRTYALHEVMPLPGYDALVEDTVVPSFDATGVEVVVENDRQDGVVEITKVDKDTGDPLAGASFKLSAEGRVLVGYEQIESNVGVKNWATSNINATTGVASSNNYGNNTAKTSVVRIPGAMSLKVQVKYQTEKTQYDWGCVWEGSHSSYTASNNYSSSVSGKLGGTEVATKTFTIPGEVCTVAFRSDSSNCSYYGMWVSVTGIKTEDDLDKPIYDERVIVYGTGVTDNNGKLSFDGLSVNKSYDLQETQAPSGYALDDSVHKITFDNRRADVRLTNAFMGEIVVQKRDANTNEPLSGANVGVFRKFVDNAWYEKVGSVSFSGDLSTSNTAKFAQHSGAACGNVYSVAANTNITLGTSDFTCGVVVSVPEGKPSVVSFNAGSNFDKANSDYLYEGYFTITKNTASGEVVVGKTDLSALSKAFYSNTSSWWRDATISNGTEFSYLLEPGTYRINFTTKYTNRVSGHYPGATNRVWFTKPLILSTVDPSTAAPSDAVNYEYCEESPLALFSSGLTGDDGRYSVSLDDPTASYVVRELVAPDGYGRNDNRFDVVMTDKRGFVQIDDDVATGHIYLRKYGYGGSSDWTSAGLGGAEFELRDLDGNAVIADIVTDSAGKAIIENVPYGSYKLVETKAPDGYRLDPDNASSNVTVNSEAVVFVSRINNHEYGKLTVIKRDKYTGEPMAGVRFEAYAGTGANRISHGYATTDENGVAVFENIDPDVRFTQYVREVSAPLGYLLAADRSYRLVNGEATVEVLNNRTNANVRLYKHDADNSNIPVQGAVFDVYDADTDTIYRRGFTTDNTGHITISNVPWGSYYLKETATAYGYALSEDPIPFEVNPDAEGAYSTGTSGTWYVPVDIANNSTITSTPGSQRTLEIEKIVSHDADAHGERVYRFKITGTDGTVRNAVVNIPTGSTSDVISIEGLSNSVEYTVEEVMANRHELTSVASETATIVGDAAVCAAESSYDKVVFTNSKKDWGDVSHTTAVTNVIRDEGYIGDAFMKSMTVLAPTATITDPSKVAFSVTAWYSDGSSVDISNEASVEFGQEWTAGLYNMPVTISYGEFVYNTELKVSIAPQSYRVEYYKDGLLDESMTQTVTLTAGQVGTEVDASISDTPFGYALTQVDGQTFTVGSALDWSHTVKVYFENDGLWANLANPDWSGGYGLIPAADVPNRSFAYGSFSLVQNNTSWTYEGDGSWSRVNKTTHLRLACGADDLSTISLLVSTNASNTYVNSYPIYINLYRWNGSAYTKIDTHTKRTSSTSTVSFNVDPGYYVVEIDSSRLSTGYTLEVEGLSVENNATTYTTQVRLGDTVADAYTVESDRVAAGQVIQASINDAPAIDGWQVQSVEPEELTLSRNPGENIITYVYAKPAPYKIVHHYIGADGAEVNTNEVTEYGLSGDTATPEQLPIFEYPYNASLTGNQGTGVIRSDGSLVLHLYYSYKAYNAAIWGAAPETVTPPSDVIPGITKVYDAYGSTSVYSYVATNNATDFTYKRRNAGKGLPNNSAFRVRITVPTARTLAVYTSISAYSSSQKPTARGVWYKWNGVEWVSVRTTTRSSSGSMNYNATEPGYYMFEGSEPSVRNSGDYISFRISKLS